MQKLFRAQLIKITEGQWLDEKAKKLIPSVTLTFMDFNKETGIPTGDTNVKWYPVDDAYQQEISPILKVGAFYWIDLSFKGKILQFQPDFKIEKDIQKINK